MRPLANIALWSGLTLAALTAAHPGHDIKAEIEERNAFMKRTTNLRVKCGAHLKARGIEQRAKARRQALAEDIRQKRGIAGTKKHLQARNITTVLATDHHSNLTGIMVNTGQDTLFSDNSSCLLQAETTEGPYYVSGEYVRNNITDEQAGIEMMVDMQVIDTNTCNPVDDVHVEFWSCNSTGVYAGIVASGNGNMNDTSNINATFLRGIQPTDSEGVVQVATLFPGHYTGRTAHIHILTHHNGTVLPNSTFQGGIISHIGQLFFDQDLITQVEQTAPYNTNTQPLTTNAEDGILTQEANTTDPVVEYVFVGDKIEDGIVAWITVGVDSMANRTVYAAASYSAGGGVSNPDQPSGGPGGPPSS